MKKISYLGPPGSWSELIALAWAEELGLERPCKGMGFGKGLFRNRMFSE